MPEQPPDASPVYDLIGIGFGPSNLALAIAIAEQNDQTDALFLEKQERFGWHRGMLIDDATMQVSFLKDLVTMRNPTSGFSFLSYLHSSNRLMDFINQKSLFPLRVEFHDYLEWAAARVADSVRYQREVIAVDPVTEAGDVTAFDVIARHGADTTTYRARNLVFGLGLEPHLPDGATPSERVWHNRDLLARVEQLTTPPRRVAVVGAGQSAAEVTKFLHDRFPDTEVCGVFSRYGYSPSDDSPFANRVFDPDAVDHFYAAPEHVKEMLLDYHGNTNYSVVDTDLIEELYRRTYQEKVLGTPRLRLFNVSRVAEAVETGDGVRATVESLTTHEKTVLDCDVLVYATGYRPADPLRLLGDLGALCHRDDQDRPVVARDYRVRTDPELRAGLYLQGGTEHTHGISSSLLSTTAVRAGQILRSISDRRAAPLVHSGWSLP
ncbi:lysine N(6)-hydroxylase/L-ornithine N(5)-oxygenase family protein [Actinophytocola gossypii]|uniref:L-lysine N6-monooxygenase MbtG n=1 Tax=Actinophytocola gossypii TaxID=2812003 RepID=A0ABT2JEU3_9PSEU|nr:lysine N(6)-hydroxylase/L-ornithine N(5)-oxygenase family protein [Actinophytocola gossypii]MCT2586393.1 lysine N(6)-hydroxylase/L-ornithine N(5)-oxygenase family protein [Actinophytocola gossypii]